MSATPHPIRCVNGAKADARLAQRLKDVTAERDAARAANRYLRDQNDRLRRELAAANIQRKHLKRTMLKQMENSYA